MDFLAAGETDIHHKRCHVPVYSYKKYVGRLADVDEKQMEVEVEVVYRDDDADMPPPLAPGTPGDPRALRPRLFVNGWQMESEGILCLIT